MKKLFKIKLKKIGDNRLEYSVVKSEIKHALLEIAKHTRGSVNESKKSETN